MDEDDVIVISSSPEPLENSRIKTGAITPATSVKGKGRARPVPIVVLDLTDSDEEITPIMEEWSVPGSSSSGSQPKRRNIQLHPQKLQQTHAGPSKTFGNVSMSSEKTTAVPLFLPSDEPHDDDVVLSESFMGKPALAPEPPSDPEVQPESDLDPISAAMTQVLAIIPNIDPDHLLGLVLTHLETHRAQTVEQVLHLLFEDPTYPKVDPRKRGKRELDEQEAAESPTRKKARVDYKSVQRRAGGPNYFQLALDQLAIDFGHIPKPHLRRQLNDHRGFYAPTFFTIAALERQFDEDPSERPYQTKAIRKTQPKGKNPVMEDLLFAEEREWVAREARGNAVLDFVGDSTDDEEGDIECQCCFSEHSFAKMVQCPEAHLFCSSCVITYASTKLGSYDASIICMHPSGCILPFPVSELRRVLPEKVMSLYERTKQQKEVEQAGLEGLEECPFCEWKAVFEVSKEVDKLFRCGNEEGGCGVVSCRGCKKEDHLPKSCKEAEQDKHLDGQHAIEEAMTKALARNCPKCQRAFIKEYGCNMMNCPYCHTPSCYVCRQVVRESNHFGKSGCPSYDSVEQRHAREVKRAAKRAMEDYKRDHPEFDQNAIKVDIPVAPPEPALPMAGYPVIGMGGMGYGFGGVWM